MALSSLPLYYDHRHPLPFLRLETVPSAQGPTAILVVAEDCHHWSTIENTVHEQDITDITSSIGSSQETVEAGSVEESAWDQDEDLESPENAEDAETMRDFEARLTDAIKQMMFVSGETAEPSIETTTLIEDIVRQQVIEMVSTLSYLHLQ